MVPSLYGERLAERLGERADLLNAQLHPWLGRSPYQPVRLLTSSGLAKITSARSLIIPAGTIAGRPSADRLADLGFGIARRRVRAIAGRDHARMKRVDVGMVEDDAS